MKHHKALLGLLAQTPIHAGTGRSTGIIDLPIQREGHTNWPCIYGSAVKGALRARAEQLKAELIRNNMGDLSTPALYREKVLEAPEIVAVYGPTTANASAHAGAVIVTDARLLLFPTRSLTSQFKWVTCPEALQRLRRDCRMFGVSLSDFAVPRVNTSGDECPALVHPETAESELFLEEYRFKVGPQALGDDLINALAGLMEREDGRDVLKKQLVVVSDDDFSHIVSHATTVRAHISIDSQSKTVREGGLWYEESLPPETLLYTCLSGNESRGGAVAMGASQVVGAVLDLFSQNPWLQVGGNETVGMGWCGVKAISGEE